MLEENSILILSNDELGSLEEHLSLEGGLSRLGVLGDSGETVGLDSEVGAGLTHGEVEEAVVTPVRAPGVSSLPVAFASGGIDTVTNNRDLVVDPGEADVLLVDVVTLTLNNAVVGGIEEITSVDTAGDGTVSVELSLHLILTLDGVVIGDVVLGEVDGLTLSIGLLAILGRLAVTADVVVGAHALLQVQSCVLLAGRVGNTSLVGVLVDSGGVATVARSTSLAVNDGLGIEGDWGWVESTVEDVESISDGGSGALSPA